MATIAENLTLLKSTKAGIKAAIEAKGVSNVGDKFSDYPAKIASIEQGTVQGKVDRVDLVQSGWKSDDFINNDLQTSWDNSVALAEVSKSRYENKTASGESTTEFWTNNTEIQFFPILSKVTQFSTARFVDGCVNLITIPAQNYPENSTDCRSMFKGCAKLAILEDLGTLKSTNCERMFYSCNNLPSVPNFDTSECTNFSEMFRDCQNLTNLPVLDFSKCTTLYFTFLRCYKLTGNLTFNSPNLQNLYGAFLDCRKLTKVTFTENPKPTQLETTFKGCTSLTAVEGLDSSAATSTKQLFSGCAALTSVPEILDTSNSSNVEDMYRDCKQLYKIPEVNCVKVTSLRNTFANSGVIGKITLSNTGNVSNWERTFAGCRKLQRISDLDMTSYVSQEDYDFYSPFEDCVNLTILGTFTNCKANLLLRSCTKLTAESLVNVFNSIYDFTAAGETPSGYQGRIYLGRAAYNRLTEDQIAIATGKGWSVQSN